MGASSTFRQRAAHADLRPSPIDPGWIIDGDPQARQVAIANCGVFLTTIWDCSAGTFLWYYGASEAVNILEGEAIITDKSGLSRTLTAGDAAMFAEGDWMHWHVPHYVRKFAVWGQPGPVVSRYVLGKLGARATRLIWRKRGASNAGRLPEIPAAPLASPSAQT